MAIPIRTAETALQQHLELAGMMAELAPEIESAGLLIQEALRAGNKVILCGNGGSAADAQHIAGEIVGRFLKERSGLPAIALASDSTVLTAIANDYGFAAVFARQVVAHGKPGDVLIAISTSGNSENVVKAAETAKNATMVVIGLTGKDGGALGKHCDFCLRVPSDYTPRIQEMHILIGHILCEIAEA